MSDPKKEGTQEEPDAQSRLAIMPEPNGEPDCSVGGSGTEAGSSEADIAAQAHVGLGIWQVVSQKTRDANIAMVNRLLSQEELYRIGAEALRAIRPAVDGGKAAAEWSAEQLAVIAKDPATRRRAAHAIKLGLVKSAQAWLGPAVAVVGLETVEKMADRLVDKTLGLLVAPPEAGNAPRPETGHILAPAATTEGVPPTEAPRPRLATRPPVSGVPDW